ncbi:MAG: serine/threonine protein kinase [Planctomycetes bacterium]|nr:serine/threonine protein kinase [Planctomycetota bacterium]
MSFCDDLEISNIEDRTSYKFTRKVAAGGMGSVYAAQQQGVEGFEKTVAIKTILPKYTDNTEFVDMFIGEAKLVANLVHPNIVQIYQLGEYDKGFYIAMEYIDGINLEQFLMRHKQLGKDVPVEIGTFIISRICRGLEYAHNKRDENGHLLGIVHRDVSPKNIMITSEGEVKLTDFGVAKARNYMEQEEGEVLMGKVEYMSPEQASYQVTDARSDLFSLGIVYYELLTGQNIFETDDVFEILERVKSAPIPKPDIYRSDLPEDVVGIIMQMLERKPEKRYQTSGEAGYALEYHMYSGGYGPTIVTLATYMAQLFPEMNFMTPSTQEMIRNADTLYRKGDTADML